MAPEAKESVELPWWPKPSSRSAAREPLSRDQIVTAAIKLIDAENLDALSMRRLGQELNAGATSMYTHVRSKDELLALVNDVIAGEILDRVSLDAGAPWRDQAVTVARAIREVLVTAHPHAAPLFAGRSNAGPNTLAIIEVLLGVLRSAGFEGKRLLLAYGAVLNHAYTYAASEAAAGAGGAHRARVMADALATSLPPDRFPNLVGVARSMADLTADDQFDFGLQRLLDGLESLLARSPS